MDYKIRLKKLKSDNVPLFYRWWNLKKLRELTSGVYKKISKKEVDEKFIGILKNKNRLDYIIFIEDDPVGHVLLQYKNKKWELYIAIGEIKYWNKGIGTKAIKIVLKNFYKNHKKSEKVYLEVNPNNCRAIRCYEKCGFKKRRIKRYKNFPKLLQMVY